MKSLWKVLSNEDVQHGVCAAMLMVALAYFIVKVLGITEVGAIP